MPKPKMTKVERDALVWVNKIRRCEGRKALAKLPKGDVKEMYSCPLARALNRGKVGVSEESLEVLGASKKKIAAFRKAHLQVIDVGANDNNEPVVFFQAPPSFVRFVSWFDTQLHPNAEAIAR